MRVPPKYSRPESKLAREERQTDAETHDAFGYRSPSSLVNAALAVLPGCRRPGAADPGWHSARWGESTIDTRHQGSVADQHVDSIAGLLLSGEPRADRSSTALWV